MSEFNPDMLSTYFRQGVSGYSPVEGRKYTLTHSDETAELFLVVGNEFAWDKVNETRDEVFAQWIMCPGGQYVMEVYLYVYGPEVSGSPEIRNTIFRRELPLALEAVCYGDREFFMNYPQLGMSPVMVHFYSTLSQYSRVEPWGNFGAYCV